MKPCPIGMKTNYLLYKIAIQAILVPKILDTRIWPPFVFVFTVFHEDDSPACTYQTNNTMNIITSSHYTN